MYGGWPCVTDDNPPCNKIAGIQTLTVLPLHKTKIPLIQADNPDNLISNVSAVLPDRAMPG